MAILTSRRGKRGGHRPGRVAICPSVAGWRVVGATPDAFVQSLHCGYEWNATGQLGGIFLPRGRAAEPLSR